MNILQPACNTAKYLLITIIRRSRNLEQITQINQVIFVFLLPNDNFFKRCIPVERRNEMPYRI